VNVPSTAVVFDESALLVLGAGHQMTSQFVCNSEHRATRYAYVPTLCLAAADASREGLADHIGALPAAHIVGLEYSGVAAIGALVRSGVSWRIAHAVQLARPSAEWPDGVPVLTAAPELYADVKLIRTIKIPEQP
jgi:hypothetical protein